MGCSPAQRLRRGGKQDLVSPAASWLELDSNEAGGTIASFTHPFTHSLIHALIHSFTHSFIHLSFTLVIHSLIHSFTHLFIHLSFTHSFIHSLI